MAAGSQRFGYIDSMRALAILGVIAVHTASKTLATEPVTGFWKLVLRVCYMGELGVPLFFAVSAFTIMMLYNKRHGTEEHYVASFYTRRMMRIAPVYWAGILMYTLIFGINGSRGWHEGPETWHYALHAAFLNMTTPYTASSVVPGGWSISDEVMFYLIFPALFLLVRSLRGAVLFMIACVLMSPVFLMLAQQLVLTAFSDADPRFQEQFLYRWLPNQMTSFAAGFVAYYMLEKADAIRSLLAQSILKSSLIVAACLAVMAGVFLAGEHAPDALKNQRFAIMLVPFFVAFGIYRWRVLDNPVLHYIGRVSFSAYLIHFLAITTFNGIVPSDLPVSTRFALVGGLTLVSTLALAGLSYRYYEQVWVRLTPAAVAAVRRVLSRPGKALRAE